eukprot:TRINITY_DN29660_c0_g2_i1.p1 TRINITY_DN29660_c0_g2~~TRINITY_DN29660_c0_g2_i1.p1  ORF type:complete len:238 (-),score=28.90 TRINITY_DN29660_c0_g2_i1:178-810(-)
MASCSPRISFPPYHGLKNSCPEAYELLKQGTLQREGLKSVRTPTSVEFVAGRERSMTGLAKVEPGRFWFAHHNERLRAADSPVSPAVLAGRCMPGLSASVPSLPGLVAGAEVASPGSQRRRKTTGSSRGGDMATTDEMLERKIQFLEDATSSRQSSSSRSSQRHGSRQKNLGVPTEDELSKKFPKRITRKGYGRCPNGGFYGFSMAAYTA